MNKRKLYEELYRAFYPESIVAFGTTNGYRNCVEDPQMVDYDVLYAIDPNMESKTWVSIINLDSVPRVLIKINDFYVVYDLGTPIEKIENETPSYRRLSAQDQTWVGKVYTTINQAFIDAGYVF